VISAAETGSADIVLGSILIVDDDRSVADTFARMLQLEGFKVTTTLDPAVGLELADSTRPQAIILDMRMPLINGLQFLRELRARPHRADVPVAIVTGDYFLPEAMQQELTSLNATLRFKPMWLEDLVGLARNLLGATP
jgi:DNA-binding response OmpR family regulator